MNNKSKHYLFTLSAFLIASALIDELSATEQNALGNWFMLVGQTLCTNGSSKFNTEYSAKNVDIDKIIQKTKTAINENL